MNDDRTDKSISFLVKHFGGTARCSKMGKWMMSERFCLPRIDICILCAGGCGYGIWDVQACKHTGTDAERAAAAPSCKLKRPSTAV
jgi:hypothetical protein